jgi:hypothetical protein
MMNLTPRVEDLFEITNLRSTFEICSLRDMLDLLCRAFHQSQTLRDESGHLYLATHNLKKGDSMSFSGQMRHTLFNRVRDTTGNRNRSKCC